MADQKEQFLGENATFKDYVELVEGEIGSAMDDLSDWKGGRGSGTAFGGSRFGPGRAENGEDEDEDEEDVENAPYYDDNMVLIPDALAQGQRVTYHIRGEAGGMEERIGTLQRDAGNGQWEVMDDENMQVAPIPLEMMSGYAAQQQESIDRLKELAGIQETATGGATGAGSIASVPGTLGTGEPVKRTKTKIKKKRNKVEP